MDQPMTNPSAEDVSLLLLRLRRYLPYLGIYASDVRTAVETIETLQRNNARLVSALTVRTHSTLRDLIGSTPALAPTISSSYEHEPDRE